MLKDFYLGGFSHTSVIVIVANFLESELAEFLNLVAHYFV